MATTEEDEQSPSPYRELNESRAEIRLVIIEKACGPTAHEIIRCRLSVVSTHDEPSYTALSYVWGDPAEPGKEPVILINGVPLSVTPSLEIALRHLRERYKGEQVAFWIDAICISQDKCDERSSQVKMMAHIYSRAETVIAWLGEANADSSKLCALINAETGDCGPGRNWTEIVQSRAAIESLFSRPYWFRMWTQQEGFLARNLSFVCGTESTPVEKIIEFFLLHLREITNMDEEEEINSVGTLGLYLYLTGIAACPMITFRILFDANQPAPTFFQLLEMTQGCVSRDPRDRLYALLGVDRNHELPVEPDYNKDVTQVYAEFTQQVLNKHSCLFLNGSNGIGTARTSQERIPGLPSWVPDFTQKSRTKCDQFRPWGTTIDRKPETMFSEDGLSMMAKGLVIDRVDGYELTEAGVLSQRH